MNQQVTILILLQRVDPNRIFWARNDVAEPEHLEDSTGHGEVQRPPSYISGDGVSHVMPPSPGWI